MISRTLSRLTAVLTGLLCVGLAAAQLPAPPLEMLPPSGSMGELRFEADTFEFGDIWDHEKVTHVFKFSNVGNEALTITDVKSTCGCTVPELTKHNYEPGESGELTVIFNPQNRSGEQHKAITVSTDSRITPIVRVSFTANVSKVLEMDPPLANLGRIFKNEGKGMKIHIKGNIPGFKAWPAKDQPESSSMFHVEVVDPSKASDEEKEAQVDAAEAVHDEAAAKMAEEPTENETIIRVWVDKGMTVGRHAEPIIIKTNDERRPEVELRCLVTVVGDLQGRPPRFALGRLEPGAPFESTVRVVNRVAEPFHITSAEPSGETGEVKITFAPVTEGAEDAYDVTVRGVAPAESQRILGRVLVHTDMEGEPVLELPIYGFVNAATPNASVPSSAAGG
ncbi:MAG: DUF1573 domain-containing protein [Phycisphaeraceae bacterium]|nr:MAG: DUF1573 domain-containing protein [Phycisphaeraceae bacterium]